MCIDSGVWIAGVVPDSGQSVLRAEIFKPAWRLRPSSFDPVCVLPVAGQTALGNQGSHSSQSADAWGELPHARFCLQPALRGQSPDDGGQNFRLVHSSPLSHEIEMLGAT